MQSMLVAILAKFLKFKSGFKSLLIFSGKIINGLTISALELDHVILTHMVVIITF